MNNFLFAHAFGQSYTLPIPLWLFLFAASAVVVVSFILVAFLFDEKKEKAPEKHETKNLGAVVPIGKAIGLFLLLLTIAAGMFGTISYLNFSVIAFWIIFLLGFTYLNAIFGNLWEIVNPFKTIVEIIEKLAHKPLAPLIEYPKKFSYYPAILIFFGLLWLELLSGGLGTEPNFLGRLLLAYTVAMVLYAIIFGKDKWFRYGEFFSVYFGLVSKLSPIKIKGKNFSLRKPFDGLIEKEAKEFSLLIFILLMLAATGFDSFRETNFFNSISQHFPDSFVAEGHFDAIVLLVSPFVLLAIYLFFVWLMKHIVRSSFSLKKLAISFAFSLIPIAAAYNMAHYFPLLVVQGPTIIKYASDPLDLGWDILGTAGSEYIATPISASIVWYAQISLIVVGHIIAVYVAHRIALRNFGSAKQALLSQYPILALMIIYTIGSLWIIGQPLSVR